MGQVSFNEDLDRFRTDLLGAKDKLWGFAHKSSMVDAERKKKAFGDCFDDFAVRLDRLKKIANEPGVVLAAEIDSLRVRRDELEHKNIAMVNEIATLKEEIRKEKIRFKQERDKFLKRVGDLTAEKLKLEKQVDDLTEKSAFDTLIDSYPPTRK